MKQRVLYLLKFYLITVVIFMMAKFVFMLYNSDGHPFSLCDFLDVITHGLSLDLCTALYFVILPFLLVFVSVYWRKKFILINILRVYYILISIAFSLAFVADTSLYEFWQFKLDASCLQYLETPTEAMASVSWAYIAIRVVIFLLVALLMYKAYLLTVRRLRTVSPQPSDWKSVAFGLLVFLVFVPLFVIGIRGGIGESTTNIGQVYYSQNEFLNHSAVNPVFSFLSSFEHSEKDYSGYDFFDESTCRQLLSNVYTKESILTDTLLNTNRPNVIVILLESCGGQFMEIGGRQDIMPNLNRLTKEGIYFTQCYANSWRTDRGTACTFSGWPSFPNVSVMKMPSKSRTMPSIAKSLGKQGYHTTYLYGGDINFTNMRSYLVGTGWERLISMHDFTKTQQKSANWGVRDDITFDSLYHIATTTKRPFLLGFSTLSSHVPWDVPIHEMDDEVENAFRYLDNCLGSFIQKLQKTDEWDNTLVIMLPDHGHRSAQIGETSPLLSHIPMIWVGGAVRAPKKISTICNQSDLAATLLGQLGLNHEDYIYSRDVLSSTYLYPLAVHNYNNAQSMIDSTGFILYDFDAKRFVVQDSKDGERMLKVSKAILQETTHNLKNR